MDDKVSRESYYNVLVNCNKQDQAIMDEEMMSGKSENYENSDFFKASMIH